MSKKMKKILILTLLACLCLGALLSVTGCGGKEVTLKNGSFESGEGSNIDGWEIYDYQKTVENPCTTIEIASENGNKYAVINSTSKNDARLVQTIKVKKNSYYKITVDVWLDKVSDGLDEDTRGAGVNVSTKRHSAHSQSLYGSTEGWQTITTYMHTGSEKEVELCICLGGFSAESPGMVKIDNVNISKVSKLPANADCFDAEAPADEAKDSEKMLMQIIFGVLLIGLVIYIVFLAIKSDDEDYKNKKNRLGETKPGLGKRDAIILLVMTLITAVMSFANLGDMSAANSDWRPVETGEYIVVEFPEETTISRIAYYGGLPGSGSFNIKYDKTTTGADGEASTTLAQAGRISEVTFYEWKFIDKTFTTKRVKIEATGSGTALNEMGFFTKNDKGEYEKVEVKVVEENYNKEANPDKNPANLFDEQEELQMYRTYENGTYFDEIYFPRTAYEHIHGESIYEWTHPPLGKTFISLGIRIFGMNPFGWRFMGTLFGVMMVPLMYLFGFKLFKDRRFAFLAGFLMMFDFMRLSQTRLATIDSYSCFFVIAMYYFMYDYFSTKSYDRPLWKSFIPLFFSGIMFGLGAASKWTCLYAGAGLAILFFIAKALEARDYLTGKVKGKGNFKSYLLKNFAPTCGACVVFFIVIPGLIYLLSYIPYMPSKGDMSLWEIMIENQKSMYNYHSGLDATHAFGSPWYTWLIDYRPIWYYSGSGAGLPAGMDSTIMSMGNPAIWWVGLICIIPALYFAFKRKEKAMILVFIAYALQLFPWILVTRVCFIYHYFTAIPFLMFMIVYVIKVLLEDKVISKYVVIGYLVVIVLLFILFYPALTGMTVKESFIDGKLRWFSSWDF